MARPPLKTNYTAEAEWELHVGRITTVSVNYCDIHRRAGCERKPEGHAWSREMGFAG
jgi:hypothetical protein